MIPSDGANDSRRRKTAIYFRARQNGARLIAPRRQRNNRGAIKCIGFFRGHCRGFKRCTTVKFPTGAVVPALGQGSARLAEGRHPQAVEEEALRMGLALGMTLIDTAESYGNGRSEELIGRVIASQRDRAFLVSKVETTHVAGDGIVRACEGSLARLGTDHLDLYLLHWPVPDTEFSRVVAGFESLRAAGKIRSWGVSNFSVRQMEDLFRIPQGDRCATNQGPL
jgi:diketogulonate reductase-like aldo/keto reductase